MEQFKPISLDEINNMSDIQLKVQLGKYSRTLREKYGMNRRDAQVFIYNIEKLSTAIKK